MKRILQILQLFLLLFWIKGILNFDELLAFLFEFFDEGSYFFLTAHKASNFTNPFRSFFIGLNGQFHCGHISFGDPIKTIDHLKECFFDLLDGCGVVGLFLYHFEIT